ncbi:3-deoxy-7-phosphoheptulonate synthase, partial [Plesiocystis pacifica SIR-1]
MEQVELARRELAGKHHGAQTLAELERWLDEHRCRT